MALRLTDLQRMMLWVALIVVALVGAALIIGLVGTSSVGPLELELRKYLIQFLLIVALGAVVAFIVQVVKDRMERTASARKYEVDTVTSLLDRLDVSYRAVKRERRSLRLVPLEEMSKTNFVKAMSRVSADKEDIEKLWRDIEVLENWLPELKPVRPKIKSMETYLNSLETEWEEEGSKPEAVFTAASLRALPGFIAKWSGQISTFERLRDPYYEARRVLITLLATKRADVDGTEAFPTGAATGEAKE